MSNSEISFYVDTLLIEAVLSEPDTYKKAGIVADILSKVKDYFGSKIKPGDPVGSVLNEIAPGAVWVLFQGLGIGKWGLLISLLMEVFHVDVKGILSSLYTKVKAMVGGGNKVSSAQIDQAVDSTVQEHNTPPTEAEAQQGLEKLKEMQANQTAQANDGKVYSSLELMHDAKMISLALIEYERQNLRLTKSAGILSMFTGSKAKGGSLLGKIFGWVIKIAFASAGLMVAGDVVNSFMGRPNSFDGTYQAGQTQTETPAAPSGPVSTQKKYPSKGDAPIPNQIPITNSPANIENLIIQIAKDTYSGLDGKEQLIRNTPGFQFIKGKFDWTNVYNPGSRTIIVPPIFTSKKQIADYFIDEVAQADTQNPA